jgi:hypothetical protein
MQKNLKPSHTDTDSIADRKEITVGSFVLYFMLVSSDSNSSGQTKELLPTAGLRNGG